MADDQDQKTEEPSARKLEQAREKGDVPKSQEVTTLFILGAGAAALAFMAGPMAGAVARMARGHYDRLDQYTISGPALLDMMGRLLTELVGVFAVFALLMIVAAAAGNLAQTGFVVSAEKIKPKLSKLSPISGLKKMFGVQGLVNLGKGVAKMAIVGAILFIILWPDRENAMQMLYWDLERVLPFAHAEAKKMAFAVVAAVAVMAAIDYAYQRHEFYKRNRMSKQEVKDEYKQTEGDPTVKAKIRQVRQERAQQRMMASVPDASLVIANPTHYAVALRYERGQQGAPLCVAKGVDDVALRIRELAEAHDVPVFENPPLARALFGSVEIDEEIPLEHYQAVAKLISAIFARAPRISQRTQ